jgi:hypothetical protein
MCDKCTELDGKIEHYERISASISDQLAIDRIKELVERLKAQKAALRPEQRVRPPQLAAYRSCNGWRCDFPSVQTKRPQVRGRSGNLGKTAR